MSDCEYCHENFCALESIENRKFRKHPCKLAKYTDGNTILRTCTATDKDLVEVEE
jgi:hypothetical protein